MLLSNKSGHTGPADVQCTLKEVRSHAKGKTAYRFLRESSWNPGSSGEGSRRCQGQYPGFSHYHFRDRRFRAPSGRQREQGKKKALEGAALSYSEADVLHAELPNVPGALAGFAGKLASKEINITCGYATVAKGAKRATVVLAVSDLDKAARVR